MEDVGVEFAQGSGEAVPAEVLSTELTEGKNKHEKLVKSR